MHLHSIRTQTLLKTALLLIGLACGSRVFAQSFKLMRYDEDYHNLKDSSKKFYNEFKFLPLNQSGSIYASFGGEIREEFAAFDNEDWGRLGIGHNNFLLQRYDLHGDLHIGDRFRIFGQLRSAWEGGRKNGPRPIDEDKLNIQNLFADWTALRKDSTSLILRLGRQELDYGSGRLISVREGPNVRLYFTGAKAMFVTRSFRIDAFVMMADTIKPGVFDNTPSKEANLWGAYSTISAGNVGNVDVYYIGIRRDTSVFEEGAKRELRHTIGGRLWRSGKGFIYNFEAAYQFGTFGTGDIRAWTASADVGYLFDIKGNPSINLRNDYISGDRKTGDGQLNTFNPIYPRGGYFGFDPQIGPANLIDIHPYATVSPWKTVTLQGDVVFNWRYSLQDGLYRPSGSFNLPGASSAKRYIGTAYLIGFVWQISPFFTLNEGLQYFHTGPFINDIIPNAKQGLFTNTRITFKF